MACLVATLGNVAAAPSTPHVETRRVGSELVVSFDLQPQRADDLAPRLAGGQPVVVTWQLDVRRKVRLWRDIPTTRGLLRVTARRGPAPGHFSIDRSLNGRPLGRTVVASLEETYRHLTSFTAVQLPDAVPIPTQGRYRLAIRAILEGGGAKRIATPWLAEVFVTD